MPVRIMPTPAGGRPLAAPPLAALHTRLDAEIAEIRRSVEAAPYPVDPILGAHSRVASMSAAYVRRHGMLAATCLGLCVDFLSQGRLEVVPEYEIPLTRVAHDIVRANHRGRTADIDLPDGGPVEETYRVDHLIVSEELGTAWLVEIKRINVELHRHKLRAPQRKLEIARLSSAAMLRGAYRISQVQPLLISLYGTSPSADVLDRGSIDAFFGLPIEAELDRLDERYRLTVTESLHARLRADFGSLSQTAALDGEASDTTPTTPLMEPAGDSTPAAPITPAQLFTGQHLQPRPGPASTPLAPRHSTKRPGPGLGLRSCSDSGLGSTTASFLEGAA